MRTVLCALTLCLTTPLGAQRWLPVLVEWPKMEISVTRDSLDLVRIGLRSATGKAESEDPSPYAMRVRTGTLERWSATVRRMTDSVEKLPRDTAAIPHMELAATARGAGGLAIGYDLTRKSGDRFLLRLLDDEGMTRWTIASDAKRVRALLTVIDTVVRRAPRPRSPPIPECQAGLRLPTAKVLVLPEARGGGRLRAPDLRRRCRRHSNRLHHLDHRTHRSAGPEKAGGGGRGIHLRPRAVRRSAHSLSDLHVVRSEWTNVRGWRGTRTGRRVTRPGPPMR